MSTRQQNEGKFASWEDLSAGGRRYRLDVTGRLGWLARYFKEVDSSEATLRFWQEIYDERAILLKFMKNSRWIKATRNCSLPPMMITKQAVADKIAAYLHHEISLAQLVDWAESAVMDAEFPERDAKTVSSVVARLGVADVRAFGLAWEDCEELLHRIGFSPRVEVVAA